MPCVKVSYLCKMLVVKYILSITVGGIILLHSVIPHEHYAKTNITPEFQSHECSTTLFDGVKLTFGFNHWDGHLEQFVKVYFNTPELLLTEILHIVFADDTNLFISSEAEETYAWLNLPPDPLRGPPC